MHRLAWSLDACLKDRVLDEKRMRELHQFFVPLNKPAAGTGSCKPLPCSDLQLAMLFISIVVYQSSWQACLQRKTACGRVPRQQGPVFAVQTYQNYQKTYLGYTHGLC